ncbi:uncharacterized protein LOC103361187 [Stegastes partitus]|uniref:Uncharacterized protein LOC103361187 n=1 Tax=Stegastes partitus TaxID=144197 RepID=A0A9Y4K9G9_9TELE|nr:PREDICTED: uncharacterized protein LOC103361187 [Stegastes partitus]
MTPPMFLSCLTCLFLGEIAQGNHLKQPSTVRQDRRYIQAKVGDNVTLTCFFHDNDDVKYYWYKQTLGQRLQRMSATYTYDKNGIFEDEFKDNPRFTLETNSGKNHLNISDVQISDSATYFCASGVSFEFKFGEGTEVNVKGSGLSIKAFVHQSASESIQPLGSVSCTLHSGDCAREHRVYWFKSEEEHRPRIMYTHGGRGDHCERKPDTQMCVYNQQMKGMDHRCAVASCGYIVFGNRTKQNLAGEVNSLVSVYFLSGALTFTTILSVLLGIVMYKMNKRKNCQSTASQAGLSAPSTTYAQGYQDADSLHYAALSIKLPKSSRREENFDETECVYSGLRQFGNGTTLDFAAEEVDSPVSVHFLSGALTLTTFLAVVLTILVCKMKKWTSCQPTEPRFPAPSIATAEGNNRDTDNLCYAAISANPPNRSRTVKNNTGNECVYSSVRK